MSVLADSPLTPESVYSRRVLCMVQRLHKRGYQQLRIAPGWSPSGASWRCAISPREALSNAHGARLADFSAAEAVYTSAMGTAYFGWPDVSDGDPERLADHFETRFPNVAAAAWTRRGIRPLV
jgi:hypothetical protein